MAQRLLDGSEETETVADRLEFIRVLEDSQTPILMLDEQGLRHLVYLMKASYDHPVNRLNGLEEVEVSVVLVDAYDGLWEQIDRIRNKVTVNISTSLLAQVNYVWGPAVADTFTWGHGSWG